MLQGEPEGNLKQNTLAQACEAGLDLTIDADSHEGYYAASFAACSFWSATKCVCYWSKMMI